MVQNPEFGETLHVCRWNDPYLPYLLYIPILVMKFSISIAWINYGKSPFSLGKSPFLMGTSPFLIGKSTINGPLSQTFGESRLLSSALLFVGALTQGHQIHRSVANQDLVGSFGDFQVKTAGFQPGCLDATGCYPPKRPLDFFSSDIREHQKCFHCPHYLTVHFCNAFFWARPISGLAHKDRVSGGQHWGSYLFALWLLATSFSAMVRMMCDLPNCKAKCGLVQSTSINNRLNHE